MTTTPKRQPIPFGKYLLLDRINIGGMAEVWRAKTFGAGGFERLVAIKRILPNIAEDEEFITMFIDEAKITVQLNHANIAQIYELSHIANSYFIAMEYVSGKDMRAVFDRCRKRGEPAPIPLSCYCIAQCCEGLDYAHRAKDKNGRDMNIVHRDVSPQNALVSYDGEVKIIDFGIAKAAGKATKTQAGILKGKFGYMSPEQIRGLPLDRRSDVFAIGVCLYEMLTGERLFVGDSDFSVLEKVRKVEVLPPSHFNRKIPEQLEHIVMRALAKDVDERYQYSSELGEDLRTFMYSTGNSFARKDLASFMKATFAEEVDKEKSRLQEYGDIKPPEGMMAAAEMGFGVGALPPVNQAPVNPSAITSAPTMVPPGAAPVLTPSGGMQAAGGLPPIMRPQPPPGSVIPTAARAGNNNLPKLTAVAPMTGEEEHAATVMVDSSDNSENDTNPRVDGGLRNRLSSSGDPATDPGRPASAAVGALRAQPEVTQAVSSPRPGPPMLTAEATVAASPRRISVGAMRAQAAADSASAPTLAGVFDSPPPQPYQPPAGLSRLPMAPSDVMVDQDDERPAFPLKWIAVAVAGLVLAAGIGVGGAFLVKQKPKGLLMVEVPTEVEGKARLSINGKDVTEDDGSPIKLWPLIREVPAGKTTVMVKADGYEPLIEMLDVREGNEVTQLTKKLKKKGESN